MFFLSDMLNRKLSLPRPGEALAGRAAPSTPAGRHHVSGRPLDGPFPPGSNGVLFGMGSFWAAERLFWQRPGVWVTAAGYAGGETPHPTHQEVSTGMTGHAQVVRVVYDPAAVGFDDLLKLFWEKHDPTQGMRQGGDVGTPFRSAIFTESGAQTAAALASREAYQLALAKVGRGRITTEIRAAAAFYLADPAHQQYLARTGFSQAAPVGTGVVFASPMGQNSA